MKKIVLALIVFSVFMFTGCQQPCEECDSYPCCNNGNHYDCVNDREKETPCPDGCDWINPENGCFECPSSDYTECYTLSDGTQLVRRCDGSRWWDASNACAYGCENGICKEAPACNQDGICDPGETDHDCPEDCAQDCLPNNVIDDPAKTEECKTRLMQAPITPVSGRTTTHSADQDADWEISLTELQRVIQFFNSDGYHCDPAGEDGYAQGPGDATCAPHDSDYYPQDWKISLTELLRVIQFYNSGGYHIQDGTEDGYGPEVDGCEDTDNDGYAAGDLPGCAPLDCNDNYNLHINPGAEERCYSYSNTDYDCDGLIGCSDEDCLLHAACDFTQLYCVEERILEESTDPSLNSFTTTLDGTSYDISLYGISDIGGEAIFSVDGEKSFPVQSIQAAKINDDWKIFVEEITIRSSSEGNDQAKICITDDKRIRPNYYYPMDGLFCGTLNIGEQKTGVDTISGETITVALSDIDYSATVDITTPSLTLNDEEISQRRTQYLGDSYYDPYIYAFTVFANEEGDPASEYLHFCYYPASSCTNGFWDSRESDEDCGYSCGREDPSLFCGEGQICFGDGYCLDGLECINHICQQPQPACGPENLGEKMCGPISTRDHQYKRIKGDASLKCEKTYKYDWYTQAYEPDYVWIDTDTNSTCKLGCDDDSGNCTCNTVDDCPCGHPGSYGNILCKGVSCVDGKCVYAQKEYFNCNIDADCPYSQTCNSAGKCEARFCESSTDCHSDELCVSHKCIPIDWAESDRISADFNVIDVIGSECQDIITTGIWGYPFSDYFKLHLGSRDLLLYAEIGGHYSSDSINIIGAGHSDYYGTPGDIEIVDQVQNKAILTIGTDTFYITYGNGRMKISPDGYCE